MTRVLDYGNEANYNPNAGARETLRVYLRLARYALRYKRKLAIVLLLSLVVAGSFTSMILGAGAAIDILFQTEEEAAQRIADYAETIRDYTQTAAGERRFWAPANAADRFTEFALDMRSPRSDGVAFVCGALIVLTIVAGLARFFQEYTAGMIGASISVQLNREMFANILAQSHRFFERQQAGEVLARFTNDAFMVNKGLTGVFVKLLREPIKAVFFLAIALSVDPVLTLVIFGVFPPVAFVIQRVGKYVKKSARGSLRKVAAMAAVIEESVRGIAIIKSFRMETYQRERVDGELGKLRRYLVRMARADAAIGPLTETIMVLGLVALIVMSERRVTAGVITPGELAQLFIALAAMLDPLRKLAGVNNLVQTSVASAERVFEFIDMQPDVVEMPDAVTLPRLSDAIRFEDVWFSYDREKDVLRGITLEIRRGEMVALVGFSGAGKTTVAKLVPRFYDPGRGRVTVDGIDIKQATLASLRDQIGVVTQDTILFYETVNGNIAFGRTDYPQDRIRAAADAAHAIEFIEKLPQGFDERLGPDGGTLSGGQRQRLAIARAIVKDPAILVLDEATSSLDSESEKAIQDALDKFVQGRTTIVIAHRLSTIRRADRIVVLHEGRVAEEGTHAELLARDGLYRRLYKTQFDSEEGQATA